MPLPCIHALQAQGADERDLGRVARAIHGQEPGRPCAEVRVDPGGQAAASILRPARAAKPTFALAPRWLPSICLRSFALLPRFDPYTTHALLPARAAASLEPGLNRECALWQGERSTDLVQSRGAESRRAVTAMGPPARQLPWFLVHGEQTVRPWRRLRGTWRLAAVNAIQFSQSPNACSRRFAPRRRRRLF